MVECKMATLCFPRVCVCTWDPSDCVTAATEVEREREEGGRAMSWAHTARNAFSDSSHGGTSFLDQFCDSLCFFQAPQVVRIHGACPKSDARGISLRFASRTSTRSRPRPSRRLRLVPPSPERRQATNRSFTTSHRHPVPFRHRSQGRSVPPGAAVLPGRVHHLAHK